MTDIKEEILVILFWINKLNSKISFIHILIAIGNSDSEQLF